MRKTCVWLLGSNGSGKTTQAKMFHEFFKTQNKQFFEGEENGVKWKYTSFGLTANLGFLKDNQCTGTDTLTNKESIELSYIKALENHMIVVVDGIMATGTWIDFLNRSDVDVFQVFLDFENYEQASSRIIERRAKKKGLKFEDIVLDERTVKNITSKINSYRNISEGSKEKCKYFLRFPAFEPAEAINKKILKKIKKIFK